MVPFDRPKLTSLRQVLAVVWARRTVVATVFACTLLLAILYVLMTPRSFTAQSVILLDPRQTRVTDGADVLQGIGTDTAGIASQVEVIRSRGLLTQVFEAEGLAEDPRFVNPGLLGRLKSLFEDGEFRRKPTNADFDDFRKRVVVQRQGATYVIEVSFTSNSPEKSAHIANAIVQRYVANEMAERARASTDVSTFLERQIKVLLEKLETAENAVELFKAKNEIVSLGDGRTLLRSEIDKFSVQLLTAREQARIAESRYQQILKVGKLGGALDEVQKIVSSPELDRLYAGYNQRAVEFARVQAAFGQRHPDYVYASSELASYKELIRTAIVRVESQLLSELDLAKINVSKAEAEMVRFQTRIEQSDRQRVQLRQLERDVDASSKVLDQFLRRAREIGQPDKLEGSKTRVIGAAVPPDDATWPKYNLILSSAAFYGLAFGIALALFLRMPLPGERAFRYRLWG